MKTKTTLRIFQVGMILLVLLMGAMTYIIIDQQDLLNESVKTIDSLKKINKQLETKLENTKSYRPLDMYEYTSNSNTETFETTDNYSYWFVYYEKKGGGIRYTYIIKQEHSYFSFKDFNKTQGADKFLVNFHRVSKQTWIENKDD